MQLAQGGQVVTLFPSVLLLPGEWRKLTVRFGDGAAPSVATVLLYVHPARAARQVEVQRKARTVESYQREVAEQTEQVRRCQEENAHLRAGQGQPEGLRGLLSAGLMGRKWGGVASENLFDPQRRFTVRKGSALDAMRVWSYRSHNQVAVELRLQLLAGGPPWEAAGAALVDAHGRVKKFQSVVVEAEATPEEARGPYTLKLWEAGGPRTVTLEGVSFPELAEDAQP